MGSLIKRIETKGIGYIEPLEGSGEWYWGMDYISGDLYEAEEIFRQGHPVSQNQLVFLHYPDGRTVQPILTKEGQYLGRPIFCDHHIAVLKVDFPCERIEIIQFDNTLKQVSLKTSLPLSIAEDCYNLMLKGSPLMLTRQGNDNHFQILWPERIEFAVGNTESFLLRRGEKLYFSAWYEDPDYREEIIVRKWNTGEIMERIPGGLWVLPDGQLWLLS